MNLVDPKAIIETARKGGYAIGAFNMHNDETAEALVWVPRRRRRR